MAEEAFSAAFGPLPEGTMLGNYRLNGLAAFTSIGELYSGTEEKKKKSCSVLVISSAISGHSPDVAARLLKKAQKACFFRHKNFVSIKETFQSGEHRCIVTEPVRGKTLRELVEEEKTLPAAPEKIAAQLADLLAASEKSDLCFGFNPDDLFVTPSGEVRCLYPGTGSLVHLFSGTTLLKDPRLRRNVLFMSPEFLLGNAGENFAGAVHSLGVLFFYTLSGQLPFQGNGEFSSMAKLLKTNSASVEMPRNAALLKRLLEQDPARRVHTGKELRSLMGIKDTSKILRNVFVIFLLCVIAGSLISLYLRMRPSSLPLPPPQHARKNFSGTTRVQRVERVQRVTRTAPPPAPQKRRTPAVTPQRVQRRAPATASQRSVPEAPRKPQIYSSTEMPLHIAARRLSRPKPLFGRQTLQTRLDYSRSRLKQLEEDLAGGAVDPRLEKLHRSRMEFRKKQIRVLSELCSKEQLFQRNSAKYSSSPANRLVRQKVEESFSALKTRADFSRRHNLIARNRQAHFPVSLLENPEVDFNMTFDFPELPADVRKKGTTKTTLALLMLSGYLMPAAKGVAILAKADAFLDGVPEMLIRRFYYNNQLSQEQLHYVTRMASVSTPPYFSAYWIFGRNTLNTTALLEEALLLMGRPYLHLLHYAIVAGECEKISLLLNADVSLEARFMGMYPLMTAYQEGRPQCAELLLKAGADPNAGDPPPQLVKESLLLCELVSAIREKNYSKAEQAISKGAPVNVHLPGRLTPLIIACQVKDVKIVELLIKKGADVNKNSLNRFSPLAAASPLMEGEGSPEIFELLLKKGARLVIYGRDHEDHLLRMLNSPA